MEGKLGIVAGSGGLPRRLVESCRTAGRDVFVLALEGSAEPATVHDVPHAWCRIGAAAAGLALLRDNNVTELVLAGGIRRPSLAALSRRGFGSSGPISFSTGRWCPRAR